MADFYFMKIKEKSNFAERFEEELGSVFKLIHIDQSSGRNVPVTLECKICKRQCTRLFYNLFKNTRCRGCQAKIAANKLHEDKWMSREEFINLLPYKPKYEILDNKINLNHAVLVKDQFGVCKVRARTLSKGGKPLVSHALDKEAYRIAYYRSIHGDKFSYPNYKYLNNTQQVNIICNRCGKEDSITECNHIKKKSGCKLCDNKVVAPLMSHEELVGKVKILSPDIEILETRGGGYHEPIICKNKYGLVKVSPDHLLSGGKGTLRSAIDKTSYMIEKFREKHNNKYTYPNYTYCGNRCKGEIYCPLHGTFFQLTDVHLMGSGCTRCSFLDSNRINGYSRTDFVNAAKGRECVLYLVKLSNNTEQFYKVGITSVSTKKRLSRSAGIKYDLEVIKEFKSYDAKFIWDKEKETHRKFKKFNYTPELYFKGSTECFNSSLPIEEVISHLSSLTTH